MLIRLLKADAVPFERLHARYGGLLELVRTLIGVVPNCDPYLEIWPPAFRTYNVLVPNFLNLPFMVWGMGAPKDVVGLGMYAASRTAGCAYCSAHTCSFALRRGTKADKVVGAVGEDLSRYSPRERAVITMARAVATVPANVSSAVRDDLLSQFSVADAEWMVLGVAMMGFLNKFMDGLGVELEEETAGEVGRLIGESGWSPGKHLDHSIPDLPQPGADGLMTKLGIIRHAPGALSLDKKWTAGVPDRWPAAGDYLRTRMGHDFPILSRLSHKRAVRALTTMLRDNLDPGASVIGIPRKLQAGVIFAREVGSPGLEAAMRQVGSPEADPTVDSLARAISPSPAQVDDDVVERCRTLSPAAIVELVTFVSLMQLVHRLEAFYPASPSA